MPIAIYEQVDFVSPSGLQERINLSKAGIASKLPAAIEALAGLGQQCHSKTDERDEFSNRAPKKSRRSQGPQ